MWGICCTFIQIINIRGMKKLEIVKEKYLDSLVMMVRSLDLQELNQQTRFLIEVIRECCDQGYYVQSEKRGVIMDRMRMSEVYYNLMITRLSQRGDLRRDNGILWLAPKWRAVKECEGNFLISEKK